MLEARSSVMFVLSKAHCIFGCGVAIPKNFRRVACCTDRQKPIRAAQSSV